MAQEAHVTDQPGASARLAIDLSGREASIALALADDPPTATVIPRSRRHNLELLPVVDKLLGARNATPESLRWVAVNHGPGSFTGLRIAVATVKMLQWANRTPVLAVPALDVAASAVDPAAWDRMAVRMSLKRDRAWSCVFRSTGMAWRAGEPGLRTADELLDELTDADGRLAWLASVGPDPAGEPEHEALRARGVTAIDAPSATASALGLYRLAQDRASRGAFDDAETLEPLYVRPPEAVELWARRHGEPASDPPPQPVAGR